MGNETPFTLHIFVADGDPDGLRLVERSNWVGKAVIFPRAVYPQVRGRAEFQQVGVYLSLGPREQGDGEVIYIYIYIGEGDPARPRLEDHYAKKDSWTRAVFFVAGPGQLNKADVQYLEAKLAARARDAKRMPIENANKPTEPTISERDRAAMDVFLENILGMLPVLGIHAFEQSPPKAARGQTLALTCQGRGVAAGGSDTPQGFVVRGGSFAAKDEVPSLKEHLPNVVELRADLLKSGVLISEADKFRFTQDYTLNLPSLAAAVVLGRSSNGRTDWKDPSGRTFKELQEAQASAS